MFIGRASFIFRYIPKSGDYVLGTVTSQLTDYYRVDIGGPQQAMLSYLSFEGATKRNRPNVKAGSLVYGQIQLASKNLEPEVGSKQTFSFDWAFAPLFSSHVSIMMDLRSAWV